MAAPIEKSWIHFFGTRLFFLHQKCLNSSPVAGSTEPLWQALVCGKNIQSSDFWSKALKSSGLLHIFVVSGSHFIVLQFLLQSLRCPQLLIKILLWIFNGITGFSAPGTRACVQITGQNFFAMRFDQSLFLLNILCLLLHPPWLQSHSFWLSWLAALILQIAPRDPLGIGAHILFFTTWTLLGFQTSLWSLILNIFLAPIIGWCLFPMAILAFIPPFDLILRGLFYGLEFVLKFLELESFPTQLKMIPQISFLVLSLHALLQARHLLNQGRILR